ncbi:MAG: polysaccharide biosynthesis C-terminal domain-containing protein [Lentimicrobiaceae bacterium]|nr:polysaccharide biosynthesis C-terminal domain-containing protein [Lentimicrobiaceae bacterium]
MKAENIKEHLKLSFIYTAAAAFTPLLQVLIQPVYEGNNRLNAVDFSHLAITELITSLVFAVALYGMGNAIARFYYDHNPQSITYRKMVSSVFSSILLRGVLIGLVAWILRDAIGLLFKQAVLQDFSTYGIACVVAGVGRAINVTAAALFRNEKKVISFVLVSVGLGVFRVGFQLIGLFFFNMSFLGYVYGSAIGAALVSIVILLVIFRKMGLHYDRKQMREINRFARPLMQYSVIVWVLSFADRFIMEGFPTQLGIYNTAVTFAAGITLVLQGLQGANQPEVFRVMKAGIHENQSAIRQYCNILLMQSLLIVFVAILPMMLYLDLFYETAVKQAAGLIPLIMMRSILRTQFVIFSYPAYFLKKTRIFLYLNVIAVIVNLALNYLLIPVYYFYGAIAAGLIADMVMTAGIYVYQKRIVDVHWNHLKTLVYPLATIVFTIIVEIMRIQLGWDYFVSGAIVVVAALGAMGGLYKNEILTFSRRLWKLS